MSDKKISIDDLSKEIANIKDSSNKGNSPEEFKSVAEIYISLARELATDDVEACRIYHGFFWEAGKTPAVSGKRYSYNGMSLNGYDIFSRGFRSMSVDDKLIRADILTTLLDDKEYGFGALGILYRMNFGDGENFTDEQLKHVKNIKNKCISTGNDSLIKQMGLARNVENSSKISPSLAEMKRNPYKR